MEVIKALQQAGFEPVRSGRHGTALRNAEGQRVTVPLHAELDRGTLQAIIKQAGLTREQFMALL